MKKFFQYINNYGIFQVFAKAFFYWMFLLFEQSVFLHKICLFVIINRSFGNKQNQKNIFETM